MTKRFTYLDASRNKYIGSFFCNDVPLTTVEVVELLNTLTNENEQLKKELKERIQFLEKELLHYMDCAIWETSSNIDEDIEKECQRLFGKTKKEMYKKYPVCDVE